MALTKAKVDLIGTYSGGNVTRSTVTAANTSVSSRIDVSAKIGLLVVFQGYATTVPTTAPKLDLFHCLADDADVEDSVPFETIYLTGMVNSTMMQVSVPIRFTEDLLFIKAKITNGATNSCDFYVGLVETNL